MGRTSKPIYEREEWTDDLRVCVKTRGMSVTHAAQLLGMSRATAYTMIATAKAAGTW